METNMKYMMQSFRSTIFTILPVIIIFGWMNANFAFEAINPGENFEIVLNFEKDSQGEISVEVPAGITVVEDSIQEAAEKVSFIFKGKNGDYIEDNSLKFDYNDRVFFKEVIITEGSKYAKKLEMIKGSNLKSIDMQYNKKVILPILNWGWLGTYIIFSIVCSMAVRKILKVY